MGIIAEVLDSRDILRNLLLRELRSSYKGSALGFMWSLLNPLVTMAIFTVVFSVVLQVQLPPNAQGVRNFPAFLLVGLLPWNQISLSMSAGATSLVGLFTMAWFYATPIIYPLSFVERVGEPWLTLYRLNPATALVETFRAILYDGRLPVALDLLWSLGSATIVLAVGWLVFQRAEPHFA